MRTQLNLAPDRSVVDLALRVRAFLGDVVIPAESSVGVDEAPSAELRLTLQAAAKDAGLFAPHVSEDLGGLGLTLNEQAVVFEEAGRSLLGPLALNCAAPDEGNMHLLERIATPTQRRQFLEPLAAGAVRSCFAMTEPPPGAGSDPELLTTRAELRSGGWVLNGDKWFITGAAGASFAIVMARTGELRGATMFLVETSAPGLHVLEHVDSLDKAFIGGHCGVELRDCFVSEEAVLGEVDKGFEYAQIRLGPARLTHCMRWLGLALRAHEIAVGYAVGRVMFGSALSDLGMAQALIADNEIDLAASRALIQRAAWVLDQGLPGREETSIAKTFVAEAVNRVVDRSIQLCGSHGISHQSPLAKFSREVRAFRIYDGPSEVHRMSLAKRAARRYATSGAT